MSECCHIPALNFDIPSSNLSFCSVIKLRFKISNWSFRFIIIIPNSTENFFAFGVIYEYKRHFRDLRINFLWGWRWVGKAWKFWKNSTLLGVLHSFKCELTVLLYPLGSSFLMLLLLLHRHELFISLRTSWHFPLLSFATFFSPHSLLLTLICSINTTLFSINIITIKLNSQQPTRERTCRRNESKWKSTRESWDWMKSIEEKYRDLIEKWVYVWTYKV